MKVDHEVVERLRKFKRGSKLRMCLLQIFTKKIHFHKYADLDKQFQVIDKDGSGTIERKEIELMLTEDNCHGFDNETLKNILS